MAASFIALVEFLDPLSFDQEGPHRGAMLVKDPQCGLYEQGNRQRVLGLLIGTHEGLDLMDSYEAEHFDFEPGGKRVADSTLALMLTFRPAFTARDVEVFSRALMDQSLRDAFGYAAPRPAVERLSHGALRTRGRVLRFFPARTKAKTVEDIPWIRSYPNGFDVDNLGTFPVGCPVPHGQTAKTGR